MASCEFAAQHTEDLKALAGYWASIAEEAARYGWQPGTPQEWDLPQLPS